VKILVVGGGAVGSWLGGAVASGGANVTVVEPGPRRELVARSGLALVAGARTTRVRVRVVGSTAEGLAAGPPDLVLVAVKSYHTAAVASELSVAAPPRIVSFQNGIGNDDVLAQACPASAIHAGTLTTGLTPRTDGAVEAARRGGVGLAPGPSGGMPADLAEAFRLGGLAVKTYDAAPPMKWSKLLLNLLGSATSAILGWTPRRVFARRALYDLERAAWLEALGVMRSLGLQPVVLPGYPVPLLAQAVRRLPLGVSYRLVAPMLAGGRGDRLPSVAADIAAGRTETENAVLSWAVVRHGQAAGVSVPVTESLASLVDEVAANSMKRLALGGRPDALLAAVRQRLAATGSSSRVR
jgi:2-dehydropantoate 2-reductase